MSESLKNCLLLDSDSAYASDIADSLQLLKYKVLHVSDLELAQKELEQNPPKLILARVNPENTPGLGVEFAQVVFDHPIRKEVPLIGLHRTGEVDTFQDETHKFYRLIKLPVEFPKFTRQVQKVLDDFEAEQGLL